MCSVSAVSDYYMRDYPNRFPSIGNPFQPTATGPLKLVDEETKDMMRQVLKMLDKIDKKLGDVECMDDAKAAFLKTLNLDPADISGG